MELNIINQIKELRNILRRKPKASVKTITRKKLKELRPKLVRREPKRKVVTTLIHGKQMTVKEISDNYGLSVEVVRARIRAGNKGHLIIRPTPRQKANLTNIV